MLRNTGKTRRGKTRANNKKVCSLVRNQNMAAERRTIRSLYFLWAAPISETVVCYFPPQFQLCACRELQASITQRLLQSERLVFQEEALSALHNLLTQDLHRYQEETQRLTCFTQKILSHRYPHQLYNMTDLLYIIQVSGRDELNFVFVVNNDWIFFFWGGWTVPLTLPFEFHFIFLLQVRQRGNAHQQTEWPQHAGKDRDRARQQHGTVHNSSQVCCLSSL